MAAWCHRSPARLPKTRGCGLGLAVDRVFARAAVLLLDAVRLRDVELHTTVRRTALTCVVALDRPRLAKALGFQPLCSNFTTFDQEGHHSFRALLTQLEVLVVVTAVIRMTLDTNTRDLGVVV